MPDQVFAGKLILAVTDLYKLPLVPAQPVYAYTFNSTQPMGYLLNDLWKLSKLLELIQVLHQTDKDLIEMLNKIEMGLVNGWSEKKCWDQDLLIEAIQVIWSMDDIYF